MPFQAAALNDRSSMPPVSVTMHDTNFFPAVDDASPLDLFSAGGFPHAAATSDTPATTATAPSLSPRPARTTVPFRSHRPCGDPWGAYARVGHPAGVATGPGGRRYQAVTSAVRTKPSMSHPGRLGGIFQ